MKEILLRKMNVNVQINPVHFACFIFAFQDIAGFAKNIRDESGRLITLIQDIIKLSQLDENRFADERTQVDLTELANIACERLKPAAEAHNITLSVEGKHISILGIRAVLEEMIYNLLDNAVKYNREGGRAEVSLIENDEQITVSVSDTGIGIPAESLTRIFERFYRVDKSHSRKIGGTGLGLSIVKHAAALHGGNVWAESNEGCGTTIYVKIPKQ